MGRDEGAARRSMTNEALRKHIGKHLQAARKAAGYKSARSFAEHMDMKATTYTSYEQGIAPFTIEQAWEFAKELGTSIDALAGYEVSQSFADPAQAALNGYWESMNDKGRSALLNSAELMSGSPDTRIKKDRPASDGIPTTMEGVA